MNDRPLRHAFMIFHCTLAVVVFLQSLSTMLHAIHAPVANPLGSHLPWFAGAEAIAAALFLLPKTLRIGGWVLLAIFAVAVAVHGFHGELSLLVYAAGVALGMVHGSAFNRGAIQPH